MCYCKLTLIAALLCQEIQTRTSNFVVASWFLEPWVSTQAKRQFKNKIELNEHASFAVPVLRRNKNNLHHNLLQHAIVSRLTREMGTGVVMSGPHKKAGGNSLTSKGRQ